MERAKVICMIREPKEIYYCLQKTEENSFEYMSDFDLAQKIREKNFQLEIAVIFRKDLPDDVCAIFDRIWNKVYNREEFDYLFDNWGECYL